MYFDFASHRCAIFIDILPIRRIHIHNPIIGGCKFAICADSCPSAINSLDGTAADIDIRGNRTDCFIGRISIRRCFAIRHHIDQTVNRNFRLLIGAGFRFNIAIHRLNAYATIFRLRITTKRKNFTFDVVPSIMYNQFAATISKQSSRHAITLYIDAHSAGIVNLHLAGRINFLHSSNRSNTSLPRATVILRIYI